MRGKSVKGFSHTWSIMVVIVEYKLDWQRFWIEEWHEKNSADKCH